MRAAVGGFVAGTIRDLVHRSEASEKKRSWFGRNFRRSKAGKGDDAEEKRLMWTACVNTVQHVLQALGRVNASSGTTTAQLSGVLKAFAQASPRARDTLVRMGAIDQIAAFLGGARGEDRTPASSHLPFARQLSSAWEEDDPYAAPENEAWVSGDRIKPGTGMPQLTPLLETLALLVTSCIPPPLSILPPPAMRDSVAQTTTPTPSPTRAGAAAGGAAATSATGTKRKKAPKEWACPKCTYHNVMRDASCQVCGHRASVHDRKGKLAVTQVSFEKPPPAPAAAAVTSSKQPDDSGEGKSAAAPSAVSVWEEHDADIWKQIGHTWIPLTAAECAAASKSGKKGKPTPTPMQLEPAVDTGADAEALRNLMRQRSVLVALIGQLSTPQRLRTVGPMLQHICWENGHVTHVVVKIIAAGIVTEGYDTLHPFYGAARVLMGAEDSLASQRRRSIMTAVLGAMRSQRKHLRATEMGIEHLLELARRCPSALAWLRGPGVDACSWIEPWLTKNINRELYTDCPKGTVLFKDRDSDRRTVNRYKGKKYLRVNVLNMMEGREVQPPPASRKEALGKSKPRYIFR